MGTHMSLKKTTTTNKIKQREPNAHYNKSSLSLKIIRGLGELKSLAKVMLFMLSVSLITCTATLLSFLSDT